MGGGIASTNTANFSAKKKGGGSGGWGGGGGTENHTPKPTLFPQEKRKRKKVKRGNPSFLGAGTTRGYLPSFTV